MKNNNTKKLQNFIESLSAIPENSAIRAQINIIADKLVSSIKKIILNHYYGVFGWFARYGLTNDELAVLSGLKSAFFEDQTGKTGAEEPLVYKSNLEKLKELTKDQWSSVRSEKKINRLFLAVCNDNTDQYDIIIGALNTHVVAQTQELISNASRIRTLNDNIGELIIERDTAKKAAVAAEQKARIADNDRISAEAQKEAALKSVEVLKEDVRLERAQNTQLQQNQNQLQASHKILEDRYDEQSQALSRVNSELQVLQEKFNKDKLVQTNNRLETEMNQSAQQLNKIKSDLKENLITINQQAIFIENKNTEIQTLTEQLYIAETNIESQQDHIAALNIQVATIKDTATRLRDINTRLRESGNVESHSAGLDIQKELEVLGVELASPVKRKNNLIDRKISVDPADLDAFERAYKIATEKLVKMKDLLSRVLAISSSNQASSTQFLQTHQFFGIEIAIKPTDEQEFHQVCAKFTRLQQQNAPTPGLSSDDEDIISKPVAFIEKGIQLDALSIATLRVSSQDDQRYIERIKQLQDELTEAQNKIAELSNSQIFMPPLPPSPPPPPPPLPSTIDEQQIKNEVLKKDSRVNLMQSIRDRAKGKGAVLKPVIATIKTNKKYMFDISKYQNTLDLIIQVKYLESKINDSTLDSKEFNAKKESLASSLSLLAADKSRAKADKDQRIILDKYDQEISDALAKEYSETELAKLFEQTQIRLSNTRKAIDVASALASSKLLDRRKAIDESNENEENDDEDWDTVSITPKTISGDDELPPPVPAALSEQELIDLYDDQQSLDLTAGSSSSFIDNVPPPPPPPPPLLLSMPSVLLGTPKPTLKSSLIVGEKKTSLNNATSVVSGPMGAFDPKAQLGKLKKAPMKVEAIENTEVAATSPFPVKLKTVSNSNDKISPANKIESASASASTLKGSATLLATQGITAKQVKQKKQPKAVPSSSSQP